MNEIINNSLHVGRNLDVDGQLKVGNDAAFSGNVRIEGWLEAPNIKGANKGVFATYESLKAAYPQPQVGWWALIPSSTVAELFDVWRADKTGWNATDKTINKVEVQDVALTNRVTALEASKDSLTTQVSGINTSVGDINTKLEATATKVQNVDERVNKVINAVNYYTCDSAANAETKTIVTTDNGHLQGASQKVKMTHANTAPIVRYSIGGVRHVMFYKGARVTAANTWEDGEVLEVWCDGYIAYSKPFYDAKQQADIEHLSAQLDMQAHSTLWQKMGDTTLLPQVNPLAPAPDIITALNQVNDKLQAQHNNLVERVNNNVSATNNLQNNIGDLQRTDEELSSKIGSLGDIPVSGTSQQSIVMALNEICDYIGELERLKTTHKASAVEAINELFAIVALNESDSAASLQKLQNRIDALNSSRVVNEGKIQANATTMADFLRRYELERTSDREAQQTGDSELNARITRERDALLQNINSEVTHRTNADTAINAAIGAAQSDISNLKAQQSNASATLATQASALNAIDTSLARTQLALGHYADRQPIQLTNIKQNKAISSEGVEVTKQGYAIAEFDGKKGDIYCFNPGEIDGSVAVFAEKITRNEVRSIDYSKTFYTEADAPNVALVGKPKVYTATYLGKTHTYTFEYTQVEGESNDAFIETIYDENRNVVGALPMSYMASVGNYEVLTNLPTGAELPLDGMCRLMSHFQGNSTIKIAVSFKIGTSATIQVVRDGIFANISTQLGTIKGDVSELQVRVAQLEHDNKMLIDCCKSLIAELEKSNEMPNIASQPMVLYAEVTPQAAVAPNNWVGVLDGGYEWNGVPSALGQIYINIKGGSGAVCYIAVPTNADPTNYEWKQI